MRTETSRNSFGGRLIPRPSCACFLEKLESSSFAAIKQACLVLFRPLLNFQFACLRPKSAASTDAPPSTFDRPVPGSCYCPTWRMIKSKSGFFGVKLAHGHD